MKRDIKAYINNCPTCLQCKSSSLSPAELVQPLPIPTQIWEDLSIDFIEDLPKSYESNAILIVVDRLSKYNHFIVLHHLFSIKEVAQLCIKEIVRLHGFPKTVVLDRGRIFSSIFWRELHTLQVVYGRDPPKLIKYEISPSPLDVIKQLLSKRDPTIKILKFNLQRHKIEPVAYKLQLLDHSTIHPVFHIFQLKKTLRTDKKTYKSTPQSAEILVSWKHLLEFESSWMTIPTFLQQFPTSHAVDKVKLMGEVMLRSQLSSTQDDLDPILRRDHHRIMY
ncbi:unnamed protein product [Spirodela intermedia]|uniref:Integrase catalytic domain-containing protein n=1 Tax=Spirodela intermedia TaxID=51605 RepID=A0A7I8IVV4_SPIIN|nr:unnamed protein product [Spirodela intermedia]CAA6661127.1 unnamed protein product [Spirodela intermedia]